MLLAFNTSSTIGTAPKSATLPPRRWTAFAGKKRSNSHGADEGDVGQIDQQKLAAARQHIHPQINDRGAFDIETPIEQNSADATPMDSVEIVIDHFPFGQAILW